MKALGRSQVCDIILNDQRPKCTENEDRIIKHLESICYQFLAQVASEAKGIRMKHHGPSIDELSPDLEID